MSEGKNSDFISKLIVILGRYLGESVRMKYGGKWVLPLDDNKNINFNTPVIVGHSSVADLEFSPFFTMRAYFLRRKHGTLQKAIDAQIKPHHANLSDLIEAE
jgi:hypothetical protein